MVCPYCNTRNTPNSLICSHCGIILKDAKATMRPPKKVTFRSLLPIILVYGTLGMLVGLGGLFIGGQLAPPDNKALMRVYSLRGLEVGFVAGVVIIYLVSAGRFLIYNQIYRRQIKNFTSLLRHSKAKADKRIAALQKENPVVAHVQQGIAYVLDDQIDNAVQQFEQAQRANLTSPEMSNAFGIALAKRGSLDTAVERFSRAITSQDKTQTPRLNIANALLQTKDAGLAEKALDHLEVAAEIRADDPLLLERLSATLIQAGKAESAIPNIQKAMELGGKEYLADGQNLLGVAHLREDRSKDALESFRAAIVADPGHSHAMANIGVLYLKQKRTAEALGRLTEAISVDPDEAKVRCDFGCALIADGALNEGIRELRQAVVQNPLLIEAHYNLGKVYSDARLYTHAERCFSTALKINPRLWQACAGMGVIHYYVGPTERAIEWYKRAEQLAPKEAVVQGGLALCAALQGDLDEAKTLYLKAIDNDPNHSESLANLGWIYMQLGDIEKAAEYSERAIMSEGATAGAFNNIALCNIHMGANDTAVKNFHKALDLDKELKGLHYNIGYSYHLNKDVDGAVKEWQLSAELEPNYPDAHTNLGVGYYRKGQFDGAIRCFSKVLTIRQDRVEDYANLGLAYARAKRHKEAIEQFDHAIQLDPLNPMLHSNRGLACLFAKRVEEAMQEWQKVAKLNAAYYKNRSSKQESEFDESAVDYVNINTMERAVHSAPGTGDFMYAILPGYGVDRWEHLINDEDMAQIPAAKQQLERSHRLLRSLKLG
ncbi:MAG TPA: tetratricopeptide repeat protein [Capsulimonadaceae bacterium]